jgi:hypothetical protein
MNNRRVALSMLGSLLLGCSEEKAMNFGEDLRHPNGLRVPAPGGFNIGTGEHGYTFVETAAVRSPRRIEVRLSEQAPALPGTRQRELGGVTVRFAVSELGSGSGGTEYELRAVKAQGARWLLLVATEQAEGGEPAFGMAWSLMARARLQAA